jgi:hypothetical protein
MSKRQRVFGALFVLALAQAACGEPAAPATPPPAEPPPAPASAKPAETTAAAPPPAETASAAPTAAPAAPAPKPLKERVVGKWQFELTAEARAYHEPAIRKKTGKDEAKFAKAMKELEEEAKKEWIEMTADTYTSYVAGDKVEAQMKYEVVKEEGTTLTVKPTKDLVAKKDIKGDMTITITMPDDDTIVMFDPKKKINLTFKRKP